MATEEVPSEFEQISRLRGIAFEYLSLGASVIGIVALAILLVYVAIDAFDLADAPAEWVMTYVLTLAVPFVGFCLYSANDPTVTRRTVGILAGGLIVTAVGFTTIEAWVGPIPRLSWHLTYLFFVVTPVTAYVAVIASQSRIGAVGFGLLARLLGGTALGLAIIILFLVFDARLWFLAYTLGVLPALLAYGAGRVRDSSRIPRLSIPIGIAGLVLAVAVRSVLRFYPIQFLIYLWTLAIPIALIGMAPIYRDTHTTAVALAGGTLAFAVTGSLWAGTLGLPAAGTLVVLTTISIPTAAYLHRIFTTQAGLPGLTLPVVLLGGALLGTAIINTLGIPTPDPWLDPSYLSRPPSRNPTDAGLYPAIVGSVVIITIVAIVAFALGVGTAVFLEEYTASAGVVGAMTRLIQVNIANLAAVPSVVYGLLGLGLFANLLGFGFGTAVTAAFTLALLILPITIISAQEAIRAVPDDLRRGSDAMGATRWQTTRNVVLPEALPGILTGTILALGRAIGETAPLIMIGAATTVFNAPTSIWSKFSAMPMQIFAWADFPQAEFRYGVVAAGVVTLLGVLLSMNAAAIIIRNRSERPR